MICQDLWQASVLIYQARFQHDAEPLGSCNWNNWKCCPGLMPFKRVMWIGNRTKSWNSGRVLWRCCQKFKKMIYVVTWEHATITISRLPTCWCAASEDPEHMSNKNTDEDLTDLLCKRQFRKTDSVKICLLVCESQWSKSYNWVDVPACLKILELGLVIWSQTVPISWRSWNVLWPSSTVKWLKMTAGHLGAILSDETMTGSDWIHTLDVDTCIIQVPYANKYAKHDTQESPTTFLWVLQVLLCCCEPRLSTNFGSLWVGGLKRKHKQQWLKLGAARQPSNCRNWSVILGSTTSLATTGTFHVFFLAMVRANT